MPARPFPEARRARRSPRRARRARGLALVLLAVALVTTACTGGSGAGGGGSLGGGYVGDGASSRASGESASGSDGFDPIRPPSWDSASSASSDDLGGAGSSGSGSGSGSTSAGAGGSTGSPSRAAGSAPSGSSSATGGSGGSGSSSGSSGGTAQALTGASGRKVFVLGDSVLMAAETMLPTQLPGWDVTVDAKVSRRMDAGLGILRDRRGEIGAVAVIHLCTNYAKGEGFAGKLDRAFELLEGVERIVLVTCVEWSDGQPEANAAITAAAQRRPNVRIADWAKVARTPGYAGADAIHLLPPGVVAISKLIAEQIGPAPVLAGPPLPTAPTMPTIPSFDTPPGTDG